MPDDQAFLDRLRHHDEVAFTEFFETYADRVYRLAIGLLKQEDDAEEVVQATFISAFEAIDRFEPQAQISTWLYRIAYNHALMLIRRRHTVDPLPEEEEDAAPFPVQLVDWSNLPDQLVLSDEAQEVLRAAINELPMGLRAAFILRDVEGLSTSECAHVQNLTNVACKVRLHRARLRLREQLSTYFSERDTAHQEETL
ncbi:MAG TPA: sigma-70 family RNA polymerase sigma factor [Ktedonobacteraceae bacterium]|nr:sigma-70 family RNA polymerase sigma factor [Ktedonobacteraceae bacterium]